MACLRYLSSLNRRTATTETGPTGLSRGELGEPCGGKGSSRTKKDYPVMWRSPEPSARDYMALTPIFGRRGLLYPL